MNIKKELEELFIDEISEKDKELAVKLLKIVNSMQNRNKSEKQVQDAVRKEIENFCDE